MQVGEWLNAKGPYASHVISSRVRLARNLEGLPFVHWAKRHHKREVLQKVKEAVKGVSMLKGAKMLQMEELTPIERQYLVERHLISPDQVKNSDSLVIIGDKEMISVMVNEEDHLRIQVLVSGLQPQVALQIANQVDDELSASLNYATSPQWGYLTACPTNVGTGLRASVMIHLAALVMAKQINKVLKGVSQLGLTIRGIHGEGTEACGDIFQVSNQITLGQTEESISDNVERISRQIISQEENAESILLSKDKELLEDKVYRALGTLANARIMNSKECMELFSILRLGVNTNILNIPYALLNELMILIQPAHIQKGAHKSLEPRERDILRACILREKLKPFL
jgi:protein arginine kinase